MADAGSSKGVMDLRSAESTVCYGSLGSRAVEFSRLTATMDGDEADREPKP